MSTRSGKGKPLTEAEQEFLDKQERIKTSQVREQAEALGREREDFETFKASEKRTLDEIASNLVSRDKDLTKWAEELKDRELAIHEKDERFKNVEEMERELERLRTESRRDRRSPLPRRHRESTPPYRSEEPTMRISYRDCMENISIFDGNNIPLPRFVEACTRARDMIPLSNELNLTRLIVGKLRGQAYAAVRDQHFDTITQLTDVLNIAFGEKKSLDEYRGELYMSHLKRGEAILDYISRIKDIRLKIIEAERRDYGPPTGEEQRDIDRAVARAFFKGLPARYRDKMTPECATHPTLAFNRAIELAGEFERDRELFGSPDRSYAIGRPKAHSTPISYETQAKRYDNSHRAYGYNYNKRDTEPPRRSNENSQPDRYRNNGRYETQTRTNDDYRGNRYRGTDRYNSQRPADRPYDRRDDRGLNQRPPDDYRRNDHFNRFQTRREQAPMHPTEGRRNLDNNDRATNDIDRALKVCRYCKNTGHLIEECRKRQYNNSRRDSGNFASRPREPDAPRVETRENTERPMNPISAESSASQQ